MKIGYLILCHKNAELVKRIAEKLTFGTDDEVFIHLDAKSSMEKFVEQLSETHQIHYVKERVSVWWGGFNSIVATINCMRAAVSAKCDRVVILQGQDYPACSNEKIHQFFRENPSVEYIKAFNITKSPNKWNYMKCWGIHLYDGVDRRKITIKSLISKCIEMVNRIGIKYRKGYYTDGNCKMDIYWGWAHFSVTRECAEYLIDFYDNNPKFNRYFKTVFPPDETYFHTIIFNSDFKSSTSMKGEMDEPDEFVGEPFCNITYFEYLPGRVKIVTDIQEYHSIKDKGFLFFRKVDDSSKKLLDYIDNITL